jgi:hypothetical protein
VNATAGAVAALIVVLLTVSFSAACSPLSVSICGPL